MRAPQAARPADDVVLAERARALARPPEEAVPDDTVDLLVLTVGGQAVAVPVRDVSEVRPPGPLAEIPGSNGVLTGLAGHHGDVLAVASLAALLGLVAAVPEQEQWVAVLHHPTAPLGLLADAAVDIVPATRAEMTSPSEPDGLVAAVLPDGTVVLRTDALLRDPRLMLTPNHPTEELS